MIMARKKLDVCVIVEHAGTLNPYKDQITSATVELLHILKDDPGLSGIDINFALMNCSENYPMDVDLVPIDQVSDSQLDGSHRNPAPALYYAIDTVCNRYRAWVDNDVEAFRPLVFFFTDGNLYPESNQERYDKIAEQIKYLADNNKILLICCGFGKVRIENLKKLTDPEHVVDIKKEDDIKDICDMAIRSRV